jgi:hypothetical protein
MLEDISRSEKHILVLQDHSHGAEIKAKALGFSSYGSGLKITKSEMIIYVSSKLPTLKTL